MFPRESCRIATEAIASMLDPRPLEPDNPRASAGAIT
jgi:hypothetical protein